MAIFFGEEASAEGVTLRFCADDDTECGRRDGDTSTSSLAAAGGGVAGCDMVRILSN